MTHDMATVQSMCHRAMLIHDGEMQLHRRPRGNGLALLPAQLRRACTSGATARDGEPSDRDFNAQVIAATLRDESGAPVENVEQGVPLDLEVMLEAARDLDGPGVCLPRPQRRRRRRLRLHHARSMSGCQPGSESGSAAQIENRLVPGRYYLDCWVRQDEDRSRRRWRSRGCGCSGSSSTGRPPGRRGRRSRQTSADIETRVSG